MKNKLIIIALSFLVMSCASRKVAKEETIEKTEVKSTSKIQTEVKTETKVLDTSTIDEIEIVPIDNSKPIVVDNKTYFNAKIKHVKRKNNITTKQTENVAKNERNDVTVERVRQTETKQTGKEPVYSWWWIIILIGVLIIIYRKFLRH